MIIGWNLAVLLENLVYGTLILYSLIKHWNNPEKKPHRLNEILYSIMYYTFGIASLFLFEGDGLSYEMENRFYLIIFLVLIGSDFFWWAFNMGPNIIYCKKHPEEKENRKYEDFVKEINESQAGANIKGDITRKFLHVFMFSIIVGVYVIFKANATAIEPNYENYWSFAKFWYTAIGYVFTNMFTTADLMRHNMYYSLPKWARTWFKTSISPREAYTFISSIPYVLTLSLFQFAPYQIMFIATAVSTFADAGASIFGKLFGKHKFPEKLDSKKSFEGLVAGCFLAYLSSVSVLLIFPFPDQTMLYVQAVGALSTIIFAITDMFVRKVADNITNVFFPGITAWILAILMGLI